MRRAVLAAAALLALVAVGVLLLAGPAWFGPSTETPDVPYDPGDDPSVRTAEVPGLRGQARGADDGPTVTNPLKPYAPPVGALTGQVLDPSGAPVEGADVYLHHARSEQGPAAEERELFEFLVAEREIAATTDASGHFTVQEAGDGLAWILARGEEFGMRVKPVRLYGGQAVGGPVELVLGVGRRFEGRVVDRHGEGVSGVRVASLDHTWQAQLISLTGMAVTGADGRFSMWTERTPGGLSSVAYTRPGIGSLVARMAFDGGSLPWPRFVDVTLRFVRAKTRTPLGGLTFSTASRQVGSDIFDCMTWAVTDEAGRAVVPLISGVLIDASGEHPSTGSFALDSNDVLEAASNSGVIPPGREASLEIVVGVRRAPTFVGTVCDPEGRPIADARVVHTRGTPRDVAGVISPLVFSGQGRFWPPSETSTDSSGHYEFASPGLNPWEYAELSIRAPGYAPLEVPCHAVASEDGPRRVDVTLRRGARLIGRVLDAKGRPLAGALVRADVHEAGFIMFGSSMDSDGMDATTGSDGRYILRGIPYDTEVVVGAVHSAGVGRGVAELRTDRRELQTAPTIRLKAGRSLRVRVLDPGGLVRPGATVSPMGGVGSWVNSGDFQTGSRSAPDKISGETGEVLFRRLPPGNHCLLVTARGTAGVAVPIVLEPGETPQDVTVRLRRSAPIQGTVVDHKGRPVTRFQLGTFHPEGTDIKSPAQWIPRFYPLNADDRKGHFKVQTVPSGVPIRLHLTSGYYQPFDVTVRGGQAPIEVVLVPWDAALLERIEAVEAKREAIQKEHGSGLEAAMAKDSELAARLQALHWEVERLQLKHEEISGGVACGASGKS